MLGVERLTRDAEIERLVPQWTALWRRVAGARPFQSPRWLLPWWRAFGSGAPVVLAARGSAGLVGVLPLYLRNEPGCRKLLPLGISLSDYVDALVDPAVPGVADALLAAVAEIPGWDECHIPDLPPDAALLAAAGPPQLAETRSAGATCTILPLPDAVDRLREVAPRKMLQNLRRARVRAAAAGDVDIARADAATLDAAMRDLFRLHETRWRDLGESGVCAEPAVRNFHVAAARGLLEDGMLRLYSLRLDGNAIASCYGFAANRVAYAYLCGFDPDAASLSPGTQILAHAIEAAIAEGAREFHFLRGGERFKYYWGAIDRPNTARTFRRSG